MLFVYELWKALRKEYRERSKSICKEPEIGQLL